MNNLLNNKIVRAILLFLIVLAIPLTVIIAQKQQELRQHASESTPLAAMELTPSTAQKSVGDTFTADIILHAGANKITGIDFTLAYDKNVLALPKVDILNIFNTVTDPGGDSQQTGTYRYVGTITSTTLDIAGDVKLGTVTFQAKTPGTTTVAFQNMQITAAGSTAALSASAQNGTYTISSTTPPSVQSVTFDPPTPGSSDDIVIALGGVANADSLDTLPVNIGFCTVTTQPCPIAYNSITSSSFNNPKLYPNTNSPFTAPSGKTYSGWFSRWLKGTDAALKTSGCHEMVLTYKPTNASLWKGQLCFAAPPTPTNVQTPTIQSVTFDPLTPGVNDDLVIALNGVSNADSLDTLNINIGMCQQTNTDNCTYDSLNASTFANPKLYPNTNSPFTAPSGKTYSGWFSRWLKDQNANLRTPGCHSVVLTYRPSNTSLWKGQLCFANVAATSTPAPIVGDANSDGIVNILDYNIWRDEFVNHSGKKSDFNNDGVIDLIDFNIWRNAFAGTATPTSTQTTQELTVDKTQVLATIHRSQARNGKAYGDGFNLVRNGTTPSTTWGFWVYLQNVSGFPEYGLGDMNGNNTGSIGPGATVPLSAFINSNKPYGTYSGSAIIKYDKLGTGAWTDGPTVNFTITLTE